MNKYTFIALYFFYFSTLKAGAIQASNINAAAFGFASIYSLDTAASSVFSSPAAVGLLKNPTAITGFGNNFQVPGLAKTAIGFVYPGNFGAIAATLSHFGDEFFGQTKASITIANELGIASLGISIDYLQNQILGFGNSRNLLINFAGIAELSPYIRMSASIHNLGQASYSKFLDDQIPTVLRTGISLKPSPAVLLLAELQKDVLLPAQLKLGLDYAVLKNLSFRTGLITEPVIPTVGLGVRLGKFRIDYGSQKSAHLGFRHELMLTKRWQ